MYILLGRKNSIIIEVFHNVHAKEACYVQDRKDQINRVTVEIFNEEYVVKGEENSEYIQMLAAYVDRRMKMIQQRNANLSNHRVAILTALNLADELNKLQEDYDQLIRTMEDEKKNRMG